MTLEDLNIFKGRIHHLQAGLKGIRTRRHVR